MATITVQRGHCFRRSGATGTHREQEFANVIGQRLAERLRAHGHTVHLIGADDPVPRADAFVALHTDGSSNRVRRGGSVGYPDAKGRLLAQAWKEEHTAAGYPGGWLRDNYTAALAGYYGFRKASGTPYRFLAEHATTTNPHDERWLAENIGAAVEAHVRALGRVLGHPTQSGTRVLGLDDKGADVSELQRLLNEHGFKLVVDGHFGPATGGAVEEFQRRHALEVDGLAGKQTMATLSEPQDRDTWVIGEIRQKWLLDGNREILGAPTTRELKMSDGRGRVSHFEHGSVYWTPERGAWVLRGEIRHAWAQADAIGYPVGDEHPVEHPDGWERRQDFEGGILFWKPGVVWLYREIWKA